MFSLKNCYLPFYPNIFHFYVQWEHSTYTVCLYLNALQRNRNHGMILQCNSHTSKSMPNLSLLKPCVSCVWHQTLQNYIFFINDNVGEIVMNYHYEYKFQNLPEKFPILDCYHIYRNT